MTEFTKLRKSWESFKRDLHKVLIDQDLYEDRAREACD